MCVVSAGRPVAVGLGLLIRTPYLDDTGLIVVLIDYGDMFIITNTDFSDSFSSVNRRLVILKQIRCQDLVPD